MTTTPSRRRRRRVLRTLRTFFGRNIKHEIGTSTATLPPTHYLREFQEDYPLYDRYFLDFFREYALYKTDLCLIDIGANCGDTALAVASVAPATRIIAVEGAPHFLTYLRHNTKTMDNIEILDGFVVHRQGNWSLVSDGSTGHLTEDSVLATSGTKYLSPHDVLDMTLNVESCIWKSDTDGYDIPILLSAFERINEQCDVVWIEFDALGNQSSMDDVSELLTRIGKLEKDVVLIDNFGHLMLRLPAGQAGGAIEQLTRWLEIQEACSGLLVNYFDLWLLPDDAADLLVRSATSILRDLRL